MTYFEMKAEIVKFLNTSKISPYDLVRIGKDICSCGKCKFFVPHYLADGSLTDFGHCRKNKIPKAVRPREISCGYWDFDEGSNADGKETSDSANNSWI